ncbi:MAG: AMIN domain-containing protein, partial [Candidatus Eisenbacteria bacterium]
MSVERCARVGLWVAMLVSAAIAIGAGSSIGAQDAPAPPAETPSVAPAERVPEASRVTGVLLTPVEPEGATLTVTATADPRPYLFQLSDPDRVVLDLMGVREGPPLQWKSEQGFIRRARWGTREGRQGEPVVRYVIETSGPAQCRLIPQGDRLVLEIQRAAGEEAVSANEEQAPVSDSFAAASQPDSPGATAGPTAPAPRGDAHVAAAIWSEPFWTEAPAAVAETQAAEDATEPEAITESQSVVEPVAFARPQADVEPEVFVEPESFVEPEAFVDTEVFIDPEAFVESEATESEASTEPAGEAHFWAGVPAAAAEFPGEFAWDQASREPQPVQPAAAEVESADEARWGSAVRNAEQISAAVDRDWLAAMETPTNRAAAPDPLNALRV